MRICHVIELAGGTSQVVLDLLRANVKAGDDATLIYSAERIEPRYTEEFAKLQGRVKFYVLPMQRKVGPHDLIDAFKLYRLIKKTGPYDVIHSHSSKGGALARLTGWLFPKTIQVYTPHAFMTMSPDASRVYGWIEWLLSWFSDAIVCVSAQEFRHARDDLKIAENKLHIIPNGVPFDYPADRAKARAQMGFGDADYIVGFVGRLVPQKNLQRLVEVFAIRSRAAARAEARDYRRRRAAPGNGTGFRHARAYSARAFHERMHGPRSHAGLRLPALHQ